jgi:hypothetical protein
MLAVAALLGAANMADIVRRPIAADAVEGSVLVGQAGAAEGIGLYDRERWTQEPFRTNIYGPVFYYAGAGALQLLGGPPTLAAGRIVSVAALLASLGFVWLLARRSLGLTRSASLAAVLIPVASAPVWQFAALNRVDSLAAALSLGGLWLALQGGWKLRIGVVLFVLALFTKVTSVAAPLAVAVVLARERRLRELAEGAILLGVLGAGGLALLQVATQGGFFTSIVRFNQNALHLQGGIARTLSASATLVLPLAAMVAVALVLRPAQAPGRIAVYFLLALGIAIGTVSKVGAALNYFLESALVAGLVLCWAWQRWSSRKPATAMAVVTAAALLVMSGSGVASQMRTRQERHALEPRLREVMQGRFALTPELTTLLRNGGVPAVQDPYVYARLAESGTLDQSPLLQLLSDCRIEVIVADADLRIPGASNLWTREVSWLVAERYSLEERIGPRHFVFRAGGKQAEKAD